MKKWVIILLIFMISIPLVFAAPPKVKLVVSPLSGDSPLTITYNENSGDNTITNWSYDFGDGIIQYGKIGNYTYGFGGTYNLILTVRNSLGETATDSTIITVTSAISKSNENTTYQTFIQGSSNLTTAIAGKTSYEISTILADKTDKELKPVKFPFTYKLKNSEIQFEKYRCDIPNGTCWYWVSAYRIDAQGRHTVATNSPIGILPPPFEVAVSESYSLATNTATITIKEDLRGAITEVIQGYCDRQPLGTPVVGTKE